MPETPVTITIDVNADAAYMALSTEPVAETIEATPEVMVDLDRLGLVVGVEVLSLEAQIPYGELISRYHVHSEVVDIVRLLRPSVGQMVTLTHGNDGTSTGVREPVPAA